MYDPGTFCEEAFLIAPSGGVQRIFQCFELQLVLSPQPQATTAATVASRHKPNRSSFVVG